MRAGRSLQQIELELQAAEPAIREAPRFFLAAA
jgi:hypothetical protein